MRPFVSLVPLFLALVGGAVPRVAEVAVAQQDSLGPPRSSREGVYSADQAERGNEIYVMSCANCHPPVTHTGAAFMAKWEGRPLLDLFEYIRASMPKNDPGTLTELEYVRVLAYLLKMNGMPAGSVELSPDSTALARIRTEFRTSRDSMPQR